MLLDASTEQRHARQLADFRSVAEAIRLDAAQKIQSARNEARTEREAIRAQVYETLERPLMAALRDEMSRHVQAQIQPLGEAMQQQIQSHLMSELQTRLYSDLHSKLSGEIDRVMSQRVHDEFDSELKRRVDAEETLAALTAASLAAVSQGPNIPTRAVSQPEVRT